MTLVQKEDAQTTPEVTKALHKLIQKVGEDIEELKFNTSVAAMMEFVNTASAGGISIADKKTFLRVLNVFAPHIAEECWELLGEASLVCSQEWPVFDPALAKDDVVVLGVQVNGKVRGTVEVPVEIEEPVVRELVLGHENSSNGKRFH